MLLLPMPVLTKIAVIKVVREVKSDLGLVEAKNLVEKTPATLLEAAKKEDAEATKVKIGSSWRQS